MAFAAPLIPEKLGHAVEWADEAFNKRRNELTRSWREIGWNRAVVTLVRTPAGPVFAVYLEGADPFEADRRFAASADPFASWFKAQLKVIFLPYVDFDQPVPGITEIFDSLAV